MPIGKESTLEKCGRGMLKLVSQRGYFLFTERQNLKIFRLRRAEAKKSDLSLSFVYFQKNCRPSGRRKKLGI